MAVNIEAMVKIHHNTDLVIFYYAFITFIVFQVPVARARVNKKALDRLDS